MQHITHILLPTNDEFACAYFPQVVRDLPQYRQEWLHETHSASWHAIGQYVSTYYVALCCAGSERDLDTLGHELMQLVLGIPLYKHDKSMLLTTLPGWMARQQQGAPFAENIFATLVEVGNLLTETLPQREQFFRFIYVLQVAHSLVVDQPTLDRLRQVLEPISACLGERSMTEESEAWEEEPCPE